MESADNCTPEASRSPVSEFYHGKSLFITGATGFVGKVLLEKLLRSCPGIDKLYVLLRNKKGKSVEERLQELLSSEVFSLLKDDKTKLLSKVRAIEGDICLPKLGIGEDDEIELIENVSVVFHSAATVRFDEPLRIAVMVNLVGTKNVFELAKKLKTLDAFIHVSTAYSNCNREEIDEIIYPTPVSPQYVLDTYELADSEIINQLAPRLMMGRPNTYTLTKALAENYLAEHSGNLPMTIVRPSIVTASRKEPQTGWVDSLGGITGIIFTISTGFLREALMDNKADVDLIPVDVLANLLIAVAWNTATNVRSPSIPVYNCTANSLDKLTWYALASTAVNFIADNPSLKAFRCTELNTTTNRFVHLIGVIKNHYIPAFFIDLMRMLTGKRPRMTRWYNNFHPVLRSLNFFSVKSWEFIRINTNALHNKLTPTDQLCFNFNMEQLDWTQYIHNYVMGVRQFIMKEDVSKPQVARKRMKYLYIRSLILKSSSFLIFLVILFRRSSMAKSLLNAVFAIIRGLIT